MRRGRVRPRWPRIRGGLIFYSNPSSPSLKSSWSVKNYSAFLWVEAYDTPRTRTSKMPINYLLVVEIHYLGKVVPSNAWLVRTSRRLRPVSAGRYPTRSRTSSMSHQYLATYHGVATLVRENPESVRSEVPRALRVRRYLPLTWGWKHLCKESCRKHGRLVRWIKWRACDVGEAKEGLENELWRRWSDVRVGEWAVL